MAFYINELDVKFVGDLMFRLTKCATSNANKGDAKSSTKGSSISRRHCRRHRKHAEKAGAASLRCDFVNEAGMRFKVPA